MGVRADRPPRVLVAGAAAAALAASSLALSARTGEAPAAAPPDASSAPCVALGALFRGSSLPSEEALASLQVETAREANRLARECLDLPSPPPGAGAAGAADPGTAAEDELRGLVEQLGPILRGIDRVDQRRVSLARLIEALRERSQMPRRRQELPQGDRCGDCDALWAALESLFAVARGGGGLSVPPRNRTIAEATTARQELEETNAKLCEHARDVLGFGFAGLERDHRYFTWTETWTTVKSVVRAWRESGVECG